MVKNPSVQHKRLKARDVFVSKGSYAQAYAPGLGIVESKRNFSAIIDVDRDDALLRQIHFAQESLEAWVSSDLSAAVRRMK